MIITVVKSVVSCFDIEKRLKTKRHKKLFMGFKARLMNGPIHFFL